MPDEPTAQDDDTAGDAGGLSKLERWFAAAVGTAFAGAGGAGIFLSDHETGTSLIFLVGAIFLFVAVQGTQITSIGKDGASPGY